METEVWSAERRRVISRMKDLLRFITCGSVDDGKSTLIGHILYDSKLLYADQERALALESKVGSRNGEIDYSLLLDGLTEEREQGITIDVAYRYFTTDVRSFIVADTPGHEEYTRNMAVGASFADLAVILVDAAKGVLMQTRRHARICSVMGIRYFVFAVNKMDLVNYDKVTFYKIESEIEKLAQELNLQNIKVIPVSATEGDNVAHVTDTMKWYTGESLLSYLENIDVDDTSKEDGFYLPVQRVCRPDHTFRGFQGQVETGKIAIGDEISVLPGNEKAHVTGIYVGNREEKEAVAGQAVTIQLDREIDISRGSVIYRNTEIKTADNITATLLWMDDAPLHNGDNYFVKIGTSLIPGIVSKILYTIDVNTGKFRETDILQKNEIAVCRISFTDRIVTAKFTDHKTLGELILIDRIRFSTSACGVVEKLGEGSGLVSGKVNTRTRETCLGQHGVSVLFKGFDGYTKPFVEEVEKKLIVEGRHTYILEEKKNGEAEEIKKILYHLNAAGIIVLLLVHDAENISVYSENDKSVIVYEKEEKSVSEAVSFVKKISSYDYAPSGEEFYTI